MFPTVDKVHMSKCIHTEAGLKKAHIQSCTTAHIQYTQTCMYEVKINVAAQTYMYICPHIHMSFAKYTERTLPSHIDSTYSTLFLLSPDCYFSTSLHTLIPT